MKLLAAKTATTATELNLGKATAVAVYASAITIIKVVANDGSFYWKDRFEGVISSLQKEDKVPSPYNVPLEDLTYGLKIVKALEGEGFKTRMDN